ncbi:adenylyltransferase/cytidyltransferase family protein [archaeon]|jgi:cytidyltransferase-like protein|nr:adenylyltransferase/cytidyltransferase family protein [archaeon]MBT3578294.1 adenylyltransferase/cytidyltransferase family protein [archaeon]MBT6819785.1 adenylyltransferase/cytidyltransferase family protein [archaeon]MBT6955810.1 adenylyltransferase/cytidyltransferase family protein [archaeon]MBT7025567.1 adenylyltransferase/cytidyltransferase family protein [archaeon]
MENKKVLVSGCFDLLHAGHVEFLNQASRYGDLYVIVGTDSNIELLKGIKPTYKEKERLFLLKNLSSVKEAILASGTGVLDFTENLKEIKPEIFIVNEDGNSPEKRKLCESLGIEYIVLMRVPHEGLSKRSSTELRTQKSKIPSRISIAGGWLDQPYVSKHHPGPNLTISLEPTETFSLRSGMATSTRNSAIRLWGNCIPNEDPRHLAKILFSFENPPGKKEIAGAQDAIGIMVPALNYAYYTGEYWPEEIRTVNDEDILSWLEDKIYLIPLKPRAEGYNVFEGCNLNEENARNLSEAAEECFRAILRKDFDSFARNFKRSFDAQVSLFPESLPDYVKEEIEKYSDIASGWKLSGAGGGGYLILVSDKPIEGAIRIRIRRE